MSDLIYMKYLQHPHTQHHHFQTILNNECTMFNVEKKSSRKKNSTWLLQENTVQALPKFLSRWDGVIERFLFIYFFLDLHFFTFCCFSNHSRDEAEWHLYVSPSVRQWKEGRSMFQTLRYPGARLNYTLAQTRGEWAPFRRDSFWSQNWVQNHSNCQSHYKTL